MADRKTDLGSISRYIHQRKMSDKERRKKAIERDIAHARKQLEVFQEELDAEDGEYQTYAKYEEHHFQGMEGVGVAFNDDRIWVCVDGRSLLRAKLMGGRLFVEFTPKDECEEEVGKDRTS